MPQPAELDVTQANLILPIELIEQIVDECLALRQRRQNDLDFDPERWYRSGEEEIILPLIQSCRLFAHIIIPKLYRHVRLNSQFSIERFLDGARFESFQLIRTMHVAKVSAECLDSGHVSYWYDMILPVHAEQRIVQSHLSTPRGFLTPYPDLMSGMSGKYVQGKGGIEHYLEDWKRSRRPRLKCLEVDGDLFNCLLPSLVKILW
ncbi:hypothetical protein HD553DRAFT_143865 [Filobasidium floriforme]|uniref:uncharacterized protein n=1 Tax=Filobasidium floriforme TaxID=5210 RepID=UPI001E8D8666|nr:uncharacterized protein HD553DRAFT_143865 [Filobasidium floriforme]KAH8078651.1 hypothetical protein HD553DRAFT_143865 [Filobasidium floriforme]